MRKGPKIYSKLPKLHLAPIHFDVAHYQPPRIKNQTDILHSFIYQKFTPPWYVPPVNEATKLGGICMCRLVANLPSSKQLDKLAGLAMLLIATAVFLYYSIWTLLMVRALNSNPHSQLVRRLMSSSHSPSLMPVTPYTTYSLPEYGPSEFQ